MGRPSAAYARTRIPVLYTLAALNNVLGTRLHLRGAGPKLAVAAPGHALEQVVRTAAVLAGVQCRGDGLEEFGGVGVPVVPRPGGACRQYGRGPDCRGEPGVAGVPGGAVFDGEHRA